MPLNLSALRRIRLALARFRRLIRRWKAARDGAAFVEFAVVLPVMTAILVGGVEVSALIAAKSRALDISATIGDLVTQNKAMDEVRLRQIMRASDAILEVGVMHAAAGSSVEITVTSAIACACKSNPKRLCFTSLWSHKHEKGKLKTGYAAEKKLRQMPRTLAFAKNDTIIMTEVTYNYIAPMQFFLQSGTLELEETSFHKPRFSDRVQHTGSQSGASKRICGSN